jgi:hypothetical protein
MTIGNPARKHHYVTIPMLPARLALGWDAFAFVAWYLREHRVPVERLRYVRHAETLVGVTATFEVMP